MRIVLSLPFAFGFVTVELCGFRCASYCFPTLRVFGLGDVEQEGGLSYRYSC